MGKDINKVINTLYYGDCLDRMKQFADDFGEFIDMIYLDPPFNSKTNYNMLFGDAEDKEHTAQYEAFTDTWTWSEVADARYRELDGAIGHELHGIITNLFGILGKSGMMAYLLSMADRLLVMHRILKPQGSIYLHCDDTSVHYLKLVMDEIFDKRNYRNDITWRRATAHNDANRYGRIADRILFYSKTNDPYWAGEKLAVQRTPEELRGSYRTVDQQYPERGRYRSDNLTGADPGNINSPSAQPWKGYEVHSRNRHWAVPKIGNYAEYIERNFIPGFRSIEGIHDRLDALDEAGLIHHPRRRGGWPGLKRYAKADQGNMPQNIILEPIGFTNFNKGGEYLGYPTQKPVGLLTKLIAASCPEGGIVLDPFCGCGTTIDAAKRLKRKWIGIDVSIFAIKIICDRRFKDSKIHIAGIPTDMASARQLATDNPFRFEEWALSLIPGLAPNKKKVGDRGIDGRGILIQKVEGFRKPKLVLAQVKGGQHVSPSHVRDFCHVIVHERAVAGVFITLDSMRNKTIPLDPPNFTLGANSYPRLLYYSVEDYFAKIRPYMPPMLDPITGKKELDWMVDMKQDNFLNITE